MDSPTAEPPRASSRKRTATSLAASDSHLDTAAPEHGDDAHGPAKKKRAPRSTAAEKQAKKVARMERNRLAAQVSRDKKRQEAELLAKRVAELEAQLVVDSPASSASPSFALPPTPASFTAALPAATTTTTTRDALVERLQDENESLKTQLALEQLQSQSLQIRLSSLEAKFGRLEQLLSHANTDVQHLSPRSTRGRHFPAAEAVPPVFPPFASTAVDVARDHDLDLGLQLDLDALLGLDFGATALDGAPVAAPAPVGDHGPVDHVPDDVVAQAWVDWASGLDLGALEASDPGLAAAPSPPVEQEREFDLFEFLRQDAAGAPEAVC
ncbi:hypothetical protein JCM3775_001530 [Rhodotorula graminis]